MIFDQIRSIANVRFEKISKISLLWNRSCYCKYLRLNFIFDSWFFLLLWLLKISSRSRITDSLSQISGGPFFVSKCLFLIHKFCCQANRLKHSIRHSRLFWKVCETKTNLTFPRVKWKIFIMKLWKSDFFYLQMPKCHGEKLKRGL